MATGNLLEVLEVLQSEPVVSGRELADRLGVDRRTVRRYVAALQALGIPVEGARGAGGGYRLRPGYRLPPLMFNEDEAVQVALALSAAAGSGLVDAGAALAKVRRVLPDALRRRVEALLPVVAFSAPATAAPSPGAAALELADAMRRNRRARIVHRGRGREVSGHGLVLHGGHWYLAAHDHERDDLRTFRADRIERVTVTGAPARPAPQGFDAVEHVRTAMARVPWTHSVAVLLDLPLEDARARMGGIPAEVHPDEDGTLLRLRADSLDWVAAVLAGLRCDFVIQEPDALNDAVAALADRLRESSSRTSPG